MINIKNVKGQILTVETDGQDGFFFHLVYAEIMLQSQTNPREEFGESEG